MYAYLHMYVHVYARFGHRMAKPLALELKRAESWRLSLVLQAPWEGDRGSERQPTALNFQAILMAKTLQVCFATISAGIFFVTQLAWRQR